MDAETALKLWGASKLPKTVSTYVSEPGKPSWVGGSFEQVPVEIDVDTVDVVFNFEEGYACCGGTNPDCYCSMAESATAEVRITAMATYGDDMETQVSTIIDPDDFDFAKIIREMVALGGPITE